MTLTTVVLWLDILAALYFVGLLAVSGADDPHWIKLFRRGIYAAAALVCSWRAYDIVDTWREISTIGAIFNLTITGSLVALSTLRRMYHIN